MDAQARDADKAVRAQIIFERTYYPDAAEVLLLEPCGQAIRTG